MENVEQRLLNPDDTMYTKPTSHLRWLDETTFGQLSSHHPFLSPSTDLTSPFVQHSLKLLAQHGTRMLMHCGTAEWFYEAAIGFTQAAKTAGMKVQLVERLGGFHVEGCVLPPDLGGAAGELQQTIIEFLESLD